MGWATAVLVDRHAWVRTLVHYSLSIGARGRIQRGLVSAEDQTRIKDLLIERFSVVMTMDVAMSVLMYAYGLDFLYVRENGQAWSLRQASPDLMWIGHERR